MNVMGDEILPIEWQNTQRRYVAYCVAHGAASPDEMLTRDRTRWPGGLMCGFILWIKAQWEAWKSETKWRGPVLSEEDHANFDIWLAEKALTVLRPNREPWTAPNRRSWWTMGPTELHDGAAIYIDDPEGGDPHIVCTLARVFRPEILDALTSEMRPESRSMSGKNTSKS